MHGFLRVLRMALKYRLTLAGVIISSLLMGVMWGANISMVYPFMEVVVYDKTMRQWIAERITSYEKQLSESDIRIREVQQRLAQPQSDAQRHAQLDLEREQRSRELLEKQLAGAKKMQPWINRYAPTTPFRTVLWITGALIVGSLLKDAFFVANMLLVERVVQLVMFDLRKQFYRQTLRLDLASLGAHSSGELLTRFTNDISFLAAGLNNLIGKALREPLRMLACIVGAAVVSWQLLLFSMLVAPPCLYLMKMLSKSLKRNSLRALTEISTFYNRLTETFTGMQTVKAFTMESFERARFHETAKALYRVFMKLCMYQSLTKPVTELFGVGVIALALVAGTYLVLTGKTDIFGIPMCSSRLSATQLLLFFGMLAGVSDPARKMSEVFSVIAGGVAASQRLFPLLDREPTIVDPVQPKSPSRPHGRLVFKDVSFHYQPSQEVLRGVSLEIPYGETVAIVGPNGCGKSTLIHLLLRFYDPIHGSIRIDGVDLREMRMRDLRERIGIVSQMTHLFDDTVANNIRYGNPSASDEQVIAAAKQAHAHRFIMEKLSDGYQTQIGQAGSRLSGGQRQRIALARAILRNPDILVLDEATSQIDIESEQLIHRALEEFIQRRTAIMITHRLSTLTLADRVVVMDAGQVIDVGTHQELMLRCELYQRLHDTQLKQAG